MCSIQTFETAPSYNHFIIETVVFVWRHSYKHDTAIYVMEDSSPTQEVRMR